MRLKDKVAIITGASAEQLEEWLRQEGILK